MPTPFDEEIESLLSQYREKREQATEARRRINEISATATSPRQSVKVTVGAQGQLTALEFPTGAYRTMPPAELAKVILTAVNDARTKALAKVTESALAGFPAGVSPSDLLQGRVDASALLPLEPRLPDVVRDYVDRGQGGHQEGRARD